MDLKDEVLERLSGLEAVLTNGPVHRDRISEEIRWLNADKDPNMVRPLIDLLVSARDALDRTGKGQGALRLVRAASRFVREHWI